MKKSPGAGVLSIALLLCLSYQGVAQQTERPAIWGIAKMTYLVSDFQLARDYYGTFLGFEEAFSYPSAAGTIVSFKVNDRQFLEFIEDKDARSKARLVSVSFETGNVEQMRKFLKEHGVQVPETTSVDAAGNEVILVHDPSGVPVEFIHFNANSPHMKSKGAFLSERRISTRIHHSGLYCTRVIDDDPFYAGILGFRELWRYPEDRALPVQMHYLQMPDCAELIEHYASDDVNFSHPCFLVSDMQETVYTLKERAGGALQDSPMVGKGKRWLLNMVNADGIKVEFTEAHMVR